MNVQQLVLRCWVERYRLLVFLMILLLLISVVSAWLMGIAAYAAPVSWFDGEPKFALGAAIEGANIAGNRDCNLTPLQYRSYTTSSGQISLLPRNVLTEQCILATPAGMVQDIGPYLQLPGASRAVMVVEDAAPARLVPVPAKRMLGVLRSSGGKGSLLEFYYGATTLGTIGPEHGTWHQDVLQIEQRGTPVVAADGQALRIGAFAFSVMGDWMVFEVPERGLVRLNTQTLQMQVFETRVASYGSGIDPAYALAISSDGRYVIVGGTNGAHVVKLYDLQDCSVAGAQFSDDVVAGCRTRVLQPQLETAMNGFETIVAPRFDMSGSSIYGAARIWTGSSYENKAITISAAGYIPVTSQYLALGDSFTSGEGDSDSTQYEIGTDSKHPENLCHLSRRSFPYLLSAQLRLTTFHNVACSGATIADMSRPQPGRSLVPGGIEGWQPGTNPAGQIGWVSQVRPNTMTITVSGNDIGFADKLAECVVYTSDCFSTKEDRQEIVSEIQAQYIPLIQLFQSIKKASPQASLYVIAYPQIVAAEGACALNVRLSDEERRLAVGMVHYLNKVIAAAARYSGVAFVDIEAALTGHRLCETGTKAVNGLNTGNDLPSALFGPVGNESYHPNAYGHVLLQAAVTQATANFTLPMPMAEDASGIPVVEPAILDRPATGRQVFKLIKDTVLDASVSSTRLSRGVVRTITSPLFKPGARVTALLHSDPVELAQSTANAEGRVSISVAISEDTRAGLHTLRLRGESPTGELLDVYQPVSVIGAAGDVDANGVSDAGQACLFVAAADVDVDHDGVDDGCDGVVAETVTPAKDYRVRNGLTERQESALDLYVERRVKTSNNQNEMDYDADMDGWAVVAISRGAAMRGRLARWWWNGGALMVAVRSDTHGCVTLSPQSLGRVVAKQKRWLQVVRSGSADCREQMPAADVDGNGIADNVQPLYRLRKLSSLRPAQGRWVIERNIIAAEAQLGLSDYDADYDGWSLVAFKEVPESYTATLLIEGGDVGLRVQAKKMCQTYKPKKSGAVLKKQNRGVVLLTQQKTTCPV